MIKNLENRMHQMQESINKDLEEWKNKHTETNTTINEIKNTLEGTSSRISEAEWISELEDKMMEITSEEQNKEWKELRIVSETSETRRRKKKRYEKNFEEIIVENFPNMEKKIVN